MKSARATLLNSVFALIVFAVIFLIAMFGDFLLLRTINAQIDAVGGEGRQIMNERYQTQDRSFIAEAESEGYQYRILLPPLAEEVKDLRDLGRKSGFAPLGLESNSKQYICNEGHGPLKLSMDRFGFRNQDVVWDKPASELVLLGDSFAFGVCQQYPNTIAGHLSTQYDLLNLSFPGATAVHYAAMLKTFGPKIKADRVVLIFYSNDNKPIKSSQLYYDLFFGPEANNSGFFDMSDVVVPTPAHQEFYRLARAEALRRKDATQRHRSGFMARNFPRLKKVLLHYSFPGVQAMAELYFSGLEDSADSINLAISTLKDHCKNSGCSPLIVYIPNSQFWDPDTRSPEFANSIARIADKLGIPYLDLTNEINKLGHEAYADAGIHLSEIGYAIVADTISDFFSEKKELE